MTHVEAILDLKKVYPSKEAKVLAIEALEKQTPKKPMGNEKNFSPVKCAYMGRCPNCKKMIDDTLKYCWNCGQAIDWSENGQ